MATDLGTLIRSRPVWVRMLLAATVISLPLTFLAAIGGDPPRNVVLLFVGQFALWLVVLTWTEWSARRSGRGSAASTTSEHRTIRERSTESILAMLIVFAVSAVVFALQGNWWFAGFVVTCSAVVAAIRWWPRRAG